MLDANMILQGCYLVLKRTGHGGMGAVYPAKGQRLGRPVEPAYPPHAKAARP